MEFSKEIVSAVKSLNDTDVILEKDFDSFISEIGRSIANEESGKSGWI